VTVMRWRGWLDRRRALTAMLLSAMSTVVPRASAEDAGPHPQPAPQRKSPAPIEAATAPWLTLPPTPTLPETTRSGHVTVNGTSIFHAQFGEGPHVLLLHGGLANSSYWGHQVGELARRFTVTVMDTRGHGRSPVMSRAFGYRIFAEDAAALLDHLAIPSAAVVGWSDGAVTGLQLTMMRPERVAKLFAFGANASPEGMIAGGASSRVFAAFAARCRDEYAKLSPHPERWPQLLAGLRPMWRSEPRFSARQMAEVRAPTAIADGEYDEIIRREHTVLMSRQIAGARLVILRQVSHFAMLQDPAQFNRALIDFLTAG
jgi:pimeloyl-ACP methyl ester carboxylesterase